MDRPARFSVIVGLLAGIGGLTVGFAFIVKESISFSPFLMLFFIPPLVSLFGASALLYITTTSERRGIVAFIVLIVSLLNFLGIFGATVILIRGT